MKKHAPHPPNFSPQRLAKQIRTYIDAQKLSLRQVAKEARVDCGVLSRLGTEETMDPRLLTIWALADYFGVSLDSLVGRGERADRQWSELREIYERLTPKQRRALLRLAREVEGQP